MAQDWGIFKKVKVDIYTPKANGTDTINGIDESHDNGRKYRNSEM